MEEKRERIKAILEKFNFERTDPKKKADKFERAHKDGRQVRGTIYFYWDQSKSSVNLSLDPSVPYENLLDISGVTLQRTPNGSGIRFGTTMKDFPKRHQQWIPDNPQSHIGRMFSIKEEALPEFLVTLAHNFDQEQTRIDKSSSYQNNIDQELNNESEKSSDNPMDELNGDLLKAAIQIEAEYKNKPGDEIDAVVKRRLGQGEFRSLLESIFGTKCNVTNLAKRNFLIASHIVPWSKSSPEEKTDPNNGLLLAANWDAVFDKGFISFDAQGNVIFSDELDDQAIIHLGLTRNACLHERCLTDKRKQYLKRHRSEIFEKWKKS